MKSDIDTVIARDPRIDPMTGDILKRFNDQFIVRATIGDLVASTHNNADEPEWIILETWKKNMANADIITLAGCGRL